MNAYYFHFPDGQEFIPALYHGRELSCHIGEKIVFEGEETLWVIKDIQHQFRQVGLESRFIMTNIILEEVKE